jgi:predicted GNAT superfamily acetyltransferase
MTDPIANGITIRTLVATEEYHQAEVAQRDIWGMTDLSEIAPASVLVTAQKNGGLVAGAFNDSGHMVGFLFGFVGVTKDGKFKHCSHLMGVLPELRRQGVGEALKRYQRDYVLKQGLFDLVTWTFDPLEGANATLNIARLGGLARRYYVNLYGEMPDGLNRGLPSDRFEVEWWVKSPRAETFLAERAMPTQADLLGQGAVLINTTRLESNGGLAPIGADLTVSSEVLLLEVPPVFQAIKALSMELALTWRAHTATIFQHYFGLGYAAIDFIREADDVTGIRRHFYVLSRQAAGIPTLEMHQ